MAVLQVGRGLSEYLAQLENLEHRADGMAGQAIWEGAKVVADQVKQNLEALPADEPKPAYQKTEGRRNPTPEEKQGLIDGWGISRKETRSGYINIKTGFSGTNANGTKNASVAMRFEAGNEYCRRLAPVSSAIRQSKGAAEAAMKAKIEELLQKEVNSNGEW